MSKSKKILIIIFSLIIILASAYTIYSFFRKSKNIEVQPTVLTEEQKITILNELNSGSKTSSVTNTERNKILDNLNTETTKNKPITEDERLKMLNSLN